MSGGSNNNGRSDNSRWVTDVPRLVINSDDIFGSWRKWHDEFLLAMELKELSLGTEEVTDNNGDTTRVPVFRGRRKVIALLQAIGDEGRQALHSQGFDVSDANLSYTQAMELLRRHYCREDTIFVKMQKLVTARQAIGEDHRDYLLRIERLSRETASTDSNNHEAREAVRIVRERFCLTLAVNGLRDNALRNELMSTLDLTWANLYTRLAACSRARESAVALDRNQAGTSSDSGSSSVELTHNIKQEVAYTQELQ